ncbi:MAG: hypothetical protein Q8928_13825 [Bacteroidota bacterium]|nr:hypothetical protein [Bacteroidota bacterium]
MALAQDSIPKNWSLNGYVTNMQSFSFQKFNEDWMSDNLIHNRLNFKWHNTANNLNFSFELRNRFISGESVKTIPGYTEMISRDDGLLNLSKNISTGKSYLFNSKIDRLNIDYTQGKFQVTVGRQRINWGQCFAWNPNDLFNSYSFFDFDYVERPGSDAVRMQYYTSGTSVVELAAKENSRHKLTSAALYRFNRWGFDIQFLGGIMNAEDYVAGTGWSGHIGGASFRGEASYFHPKNNFKDTSGVWAISVGSEYVFKNSLSLQFEVLYNKNKFQDVSSFEGLYNADLSPKNLSFTPVSVLTQIAYPITPLFNASLSVMYFPKLKGFFVGPTFVYSVTDNIDFSLITQSFAGQLITSQTTYFHMTFLRLKWNF